MISQKVFFKHNLNSIQLHRLKLYVHMETTLHCRIHYISEICSTDKDSRELFHLSKEFIYEGTFPCVLCLVPVIEKEELHHSAPPLQKHHEYSVHLPLPTCSKYHSDCTISKLHESTHIITSICFYFIIFNYHFMIEFQNF